MSRGGQSDRGLGAGVATLVALKEAGRCVSTAAVAGERAEFMGCSVGCVAAALGNLAAAGLPEHRRDADAIREVTDEAK